MGATGSTFATLLKIFMMFNPAIAVHGGAGPVSALVRKHEPLIEAGLRAALLEGNAVLQDGGSSVDAVEAAVKSLENNIVFNAGRGSALNASGHVEMDASIMDGRLLRAGAVAGVTNVKNPVAVARLIMEKTNHVLMSGHEAQKLAVDSGHQLFPDAYFISADQFDEFWESANSQDVHDQMNQRVHGTVGAVAVDRLGNVAAATSTGGTPNALPGRIGDSCLIGAGCYANNNTCAVSGTGDGEFLITGVIANAISNVVEYKGMSLQEACNYVINEKNKEVEGDLGVIAVNRKGDIALSFNSGRMHRAWLSPGEQVQVKIYR